MTEYMCMIGYCVSDVYYYGSCSLLGTFSHWIFLTPSYHFTLIKILRKDILCSYFVDMEAKAYQVK
jgi:hypothetical protein